MDFKKIFIKSIFVFLSGLSAIAQADPLCESIFLKEINARERVSTAVQGGTPSMAEMLWQLRVDRKLIYQGQHKYQPGSEFLASNEFDWLATPFDHKPSDVMVAFGTNSAWDIAVNKNVKRLYIMDWSPYPVLAQAYLVAPLLRMANTPAEFLVLLSGRVPTRENVAGDLRNIFQESVDHSGKAGWVKNEQTVRLLEFLGTREDISAFELRFLSSYFLGMANPQGSKTGIGPFQNLRHPTFAKILNFYDQRYNPEISDSQHRDVKKLSQLDQVSVFSSVEKFKKLKNLYDGNNVKYALSGITDMQAYKAVQEREAPGQKFVFSITNIFDCGCYNGLTMKDLGTYLKGITGMFSGGEQNPLVVFRTTEGGPPHGFFRYDLKSAADVDALKLEPVTRLDFRQVR